MWRCDYCRATFEDRDLGINHARARHSRDYTACRLVERPAAGGWGVLALTHLIAAVLVAPVLSAVRHGS
jgi:hypothetical protein